MATEQDDTFPGWQQLQQQQQFQQAPQQEPADLVTYHESDPRPGEEGYEEEEAPYIRSEPEPRQNAVVEGDDADLEQAKEEEPDEDLIEDTIEIPIQNSYGDEQTQAVSIRGNKEAVERIKSERWRTLTIQGRRPSWRGSVTVLLKPFAKPKTRLGRNMFSN
jgi:hypothetical protein